MIRQKQVAALPLRRGKDGELEVLLVTSRDTGRWIIPKGWPSKRRKDHKAAAREAREEAGVKGRITPEAIGRYQYLKRELTDAGPIEVTVFLLTVRKEYQHWPEQRERRRAWFALEGAAEKVEEPQLSSLIEMLKSPGMSDRSTQTA